MSILKDFLAKKDHLLDANRQLMEIIENNFNADDLNNLKDFTQEIEHNLTFNVACVGEFNSGKTTFINKFLLQDDLLPTGIVPTTNRLTIVKYSDQLEAEIVKNDGSSIVVEEDIKQRLEGTVSAKGEDFSDVDHVVLSMPSPVLQKGVVVIDTPGLNDPDAARMKITYDYLHNVDAILYFIDAQMAWTKNQKEFIEESLLGRNDLEKLFVLLNYWDVIEEEDDRREVLGRVKGELKKSIEVVEKTLNDGSSRMMIPEVLPVSAKTAENIDTVEEKIWSYLAEKKETKILDAKIRRFNCIVDSFGSILGKQIDVSKKNQEELTEYKEKLVSEIEEYKQKCKEYSDTLKKELEPVFEDYYSNIGDLFDDLISDLGTKLENLLNSTRTDIDKEIALNLSRLQNDFETDLRRKENRFLKKIEKIIETHKGKSTTLSSRNIFPLSCLKVAGRFPIDADTDVLVKTVGMLGGAGGITSTGAGIFHVAAPSSGLFTTVSQYVLGGKIAMTTVVGLTGAAVGIVCIGAYIFLKQYKIEKRHKQIRELIHDCEDQFKSSKKEFLLNLAQSQMKIIQGICENVDYEVKKAYEEKLEELRNISDCDNKNYTNESYELAEKIQALKI